MSNNTLSLFFVATKGAANYVAHAPFALTIFVLGIRLALALFTMGTTKA
jgi:hypothetical protein